MSFDDRRGLKQGTLNTYLPLASAHGARLLPDARAERVTVATGRATRTEAVHTTADGRAGRVTVRAGRVVARGAVHMSALLLRSGLRHPHLGQHLHPTVVVPARCPPSTSKMAASATPNCSTSCYVCPGNRAASAFSAPTR